MVVNFRRVVAQVDRSLRDAATGTHCHRALRDASPLVYPATPVEIDIAVTDTEGAPLASAKAKILAPDAEYGSWWGRQAGR
jgi:hypothetical protein